jgi:hypothetical protein
MLLTLCVCLVVDAEKQTQAGALVDCQYADFRELSQSQRSQKSRICGNFEFIVVVGCCCCCCCCWCCVDSDFVVQSFSNANLKGPFPLMDNQKLTALCELLQRCYADCVD